jgi:hypothetical protein
VAAVFGEIREQIAYDIAFMQIGAGAAGLISALIVRGAGYRLVNLRHITPSTANPDSQSSHAIV